MPAPYDLSAFAPSYRAARALFLDAAEQAALDVQSHVHPLLGSDGEQLAMDVVLDGPAHARELLIISSACHGLEGFCGSGVQVSLLRDAAWREQLSQSGVAVLYIHALNPYGFSWLRRVTQENVDLNRNFVDFNQPLPQNPGYAQLVGYVVPPNWPPSAENETHIQAYANAHGPLALQEALSGGQYQDPEGIFFGGHNPTWSHVTLRHVLQEHARHAGHLGWIDLHTGLGPSGHGERIAMHAGGSAGLARARAWWGSQVTCLDDGSSSSAPLRGLMWNAAEQECPQAQYTGIALEYGTQSVEQVMNALRADQWLENHPQADAATREPIKRQVLEAFYVDTPGWKQQILQQGFEAVQLALVGLQNTRS